MTDADKDSADRRILLSYLAIDTWCGTVGIRLTCSAVPDGKKREGFP